MKLERKENGVFRNNQCIDTRRMGIRVKVIPAMRSFNHSEPVFEVTDDYLKTILYPVKDSIIKNDLKNTLDDPKNDPRKTDLKIKIIDIIKNDPNASYEKLAEQIQVSKATIKRILQKMKNVNLIVRQGAKKGGYWSVNALKET
ncbi:MAG TPA: winged helix-turn-helix transcriptional regulator [Candidatus Cloacimonadota bacterium]|nr:winged helix-turn-helix transcriptional regulator [Candidatus Cloacimonadota bacterium]